MGSEGEVTNVKPCSWHTGPGLLTGVPESATHCFLLKPLPNFREEGPLRVRAVRDLNCFVVFALHHSFQCLSPLCCCLYYNTSRLERVLFDLLDYTVCLYNVLYNCSLK